MPMFHFRKAAIVSLLLAAPLLSRALERTDLLPPDAQTYVRVSNTTEFWAKLKKSSLGRLWMDPQFQDFLGHPDAETWRDLFFEGEESAENEVFLEQLKMLTGEVVLAFDNDYENPYIIAAITKEDFLRSLDLDAKLNEVTDRTFETKKSTFQGVEIIQYIEAAGTPDETMSWQAHVGNTLILGYTREWVEQCIVRMKKEEIVEPNGNPVFSLNLPLAQLIRETINEMKEEAAGQPQAYEPEVLFEALGLLGIEGFTTRVELRDTELEANSTFRVSDLSKGLFAILDVQPSELPTVTFIPDSIASIEVGRFNLLGLWQEIPNILSVAMPSVKPQYDIMLAMLQQQTGIDLEQDLLANIGTKYVSFSVVEGETQHSIIAVELRDAAAFRKGIESALTAPALQPQVAAGIDIQDFLEHTIYTLKDSDPAETMGLSIAGDYLLYGQPEALRQVIRSQTRDAAANMAFEQTDLVKGLRQHTTSKAFTFSAIDWKKNMDVIIHELTKPEYVMMIRQNWARSGSALPPPDFNKLPPADHIASFFNVSYQYIEANAAGLHQKIILKYGQE
jgi:hypothetical protein